MKAKKYLFILIFYLFLISIITNNINKLIPKTKELEEEKTVLEINKIIIIGDSRMELINNKKQVLNIPNSIVFIAKSGAKISWLYEIGLQKLYETIEHRKKYKYHVVFNLGVNDLDDDVNIVNLANEYYKVYNRIIRDNRDISFYLLSVNPVDENRIYTNFSMHNKRTNDKIEKFNNYLMNFINKDKLKNVKYCDSYNELEFYLPDGLHYDTQTDKKIIKYIIEKCVKIS